jgi:Fur family ferric uptake transcriptional regulator
MTTYRTRQRQAVLDALMRAPGFLSAQALHTRLRAAGEHMALSTVYRALRVLTQTGQVDTLHHDGSEQLFHAGPGSGRGHYLVCRHCDRHIPIDAETAQHWACAVAAEHGYTEVRTIIELSGTCLPCQRTRPGDTDHDG